MINKIINKINNFFFKFVPKIESDFYNIKHIGTQYGGYDIFDDNLSQPIIISCGLGEDASFDIEMINIYDAKVFSIDPTPRSCEYYNNLKKRFGKIGNGKFNETGFLNVDLYNLKKVNNNNFRYINKAIWSEYDKEIQLFFPKNKNFVSLSINNKEQYDEKNYILSKTISYDQIIKKHNLEKVDILKLDIEGAEIEVIHSLLNQEEKIFPNQLIVEFDIRRRPSFKSLRELNKVHRKIKKYYKLININAKGDFTYLRH